MILGNFTYEVSISKNKFFSATYVKIQRNEENVGGAYRRHEGEGDEMHASAEVRRFKSVHCTQIESCLSILRAYCTVKNFLGLHFSEVFLRPGRL